MSYDFSRSAGHTVLMPRTTKKAPPRPVCLRLRAVRKSLGLTQIKMGEWLGLDQGTYKQYETRSPPAPKVIAKIETSLGIPAIYFVDDACPDNGKFQELMLTLQEKISSGALIITTKVLNSSYNEAARGTPNDPSTREGNMGSGTLDYIFEVLKRIEAKTDANSQAIEDLKKGINSPDFTRGRSRR